MPTSGLGSINFRPCISGLGFWDAALSCLVHLPANNAAAPSDASPAADNDENDFELPKSDVGPNQWQANNRKQGY